MANGAELAMILRAKDENTQAVFSGVAKEAQGMVAGVKSALSGLVAIDLASSIKDGIGAIFGGAIEAADGVGRLQAELGLTRQQAEDLGSVATAVFRDGFGGSAGEVNAAVATVRQNLGDLGSVVTQEMTQAALTVKDLFGASEAESTRTVAVMTRNFQGLSQTDAFDLITAGFQKGGNYSDELLDTLREYSPQFASMGMSAEQMMGVLIAGAQAGAFNLDKVGDAVKEFNIRAKDGSKATTEGFAAIGLDAAKMGADIAAGGEKGQRAFQATIAGLAAMEDPVKRNAAGVALFGTQWEDLESQVITAMAAGMQGVEGFRGSTAAAASASAGIGVQWETLKRQAMGLLIDGITPLMPGFMALASGAISSLQSMLGPIREIGYALGELFTGSGDAASILEQFMPPDLAESLANSVYGLGEAWRAVFEGDIEGAIGSALLALEDFGSFIAGAVEGWASAFAAWVDGADTEMSGQLGEMITGLMGWIQTSATAIVERLAIWAGAFVDWVAPKIPPLLAALGGLLAELLGWVLTVGLPQLLSTLVQWGLAFVDWVAPRIGPLLAALGGLLLALGGWLLGTALPAIVSQLLQWGAAFVEWVAPMIPQLLLALVGLHLQVTLWIGQQVAALGTALLEWAKAFVEWVAQAIADLPGKLAEILSAITGWVAGAIGSVRESARSLGQAFIDGVVAAIRGGYSAISGAINSIISGALQGAQDDNEVRSPSRKWARELGEPLGQGVLLGLQEATRPMGEAVTGLTSPAGIRPTAAPTFAGAAAQGGGVTVVFQGPVYGWPDFESAVVDAVGGGFRRGVGLGVR